MEETINILRDEEYVSLINNLSESIYQYSLVTKNNFKCIQEIFQTLDVELSQNEEITNFLILSDYNDNNLNNFFSNAKSIFKGLKETRKKYLNKISSYINYILSEKYEIILPKRNYSQGYLKINKRNATQKKVNNTILKIMNLIINLNKYSDIIGLYSEQDKEEYLQLLNIIIKELKNNQKNEIQKMLNDYDNNYIAISNSEKIDYEKLINTYKMYISQLETKNKDLKKKLWIFSKNKKYNNTQIGRYYNSTAENRVFEDNSLSSFQKLTNIIKKERYYSSQKDKKIRELTIINNDLKKINKEHDLLYIRNLKKDNDLINNNTSISTSYNNTYFNSNISKLSSLTKKIKDLKRQNIILIKNIKEKEKENNLLKKEYSNKNIIPDDQNEEILNLKKEVNNHKNTILNLQNQLDNKEKEHKLKMKHYEKILNELDQYKKKNEEKDVIIKKLKNEINESINNINKYKYELDEKEDIIKNLKSSVIEFQKDLESEKNKTGKVNEYILKIEEEKCKNKENLDKINLQSSEIDNLQKKINEKDILINKLNENTKIKNENDIKELNEKNKLLIEENKELKKSILESANQQTINNQSINEYREKVKELEQKNNLLEDKLEKTKKDNESTNILIEEEKNRIKEENEKLKLKIKNSENENILIKNQNEELKKEIENLNKKDNIKCLTESNPSDYEKEYNPNDLAKNAENINNSEDMRIDFPGLNDISDKYEDLKKKFEEIKTIFIYILSHSKIEESDAKQKTERACEILEINLD